MHRPKSRGRSGQLFHILVCQPQRRQQRGNNVLQHLQGLEGRSLNYICRCEVSADDRQRTVGASSTVLHSSDDDATVSALSLVVDEEKVICMFCEQHLDLSARSEYGVFVVQRASLSEEDVRQRQDCAFNRAP